MIHGSGGAELVLVLLISFLPNLLGMVLTMFIHIFTSGPQGKLRAERDHFFAGSSIGQVRDQLQKRLLADGFKMIKTGNAHALQAERTTPRPKQSVLADYPFKSTKLLVEVRLQPHAKGVASHLAVQCKDFQLADVGESEYLEAMLDFVSLKPAVRKIPPTVNGKCYGAMINGIVCLLLPLMLLGNTASSTGLAIVAGIILASINTFISAFWGAGEVLVARARYHGLPLAAAAMLLTIAASSIAIYAQFFAT
ncbi:hypothetical protein IT570_06255 [Candidatus Sumerlaeota bacterium]|nr:hypothetical protein [Candidatus Sumerlaeota bacterium]